MTLLDVLRKQRNIKRWGTNFMIRPDTVAEHAHYVAYMALKIGTEHPKEVKLETLLAKAIMHDSEESCTGDIVYAFKGQDSKTRNFVERKSEEIFIMRYGRDNPKTFRYYLEGKTIEDRIVKFCDYVDAYFTLAEEIRMGNKLANVPLERQYKAITNSFKESIFTKYIEELKFINDNLR